MVQCEPNNGTAQETINASEEAFNDLNYWRYPPALPTDLGMECDVPRPYSPEEYAPDSPQRPGQHEEEEEDNDDEDDDDYEDNYQTRDDPMGLLSGGAGVRLLGLLGQLSAHLGSSSRFSRAAELLQEDMIRQREHALRVEEERSSVSMDEDGQEHPSEATHAQRIEPLEGSTLQQPEVLSSVGSLLQILQNNEQLQQSPSVPQAPPLVLFDVTDGAEAPPSPASPASVSRLSPPCPSFGLDDAAPSACPICLESIDGSCLDTLLQMPCARQHVFQNLPSHLARHTQHVPRVPTRAARGHRGRDGRADSACPGRGRAVAGGRRRASNRAGDRSRRSCVLCGLWHLPCNPVYIICRARACARMGCPAWLYSMMCA